MRWLALLAIFVVSCQAGLAQETKGFNLPSDWRREVVKLPPDFAPTMTWKGTEILGFSPGMFDPKANDFFTYVFLLSLDSGSPDWESQLLLYYRGLAKAVLKNPKLDTSGFRLDLKGSADSRSGKLVWIEPFQTQKPQVPYLELRRLNKTHWFVCVSPQVPDSKVWVTLRQIRNSQTL